MSNSSVPRPPTRVARYLRASWTIDALVALALAGWYYRFGLRHFDSVLYDTFDQKLMIYLLEWLYHSFFGEGHIAGVFSPNMLYPNTNVLAWSDTMLGYLPAYALFRSITPNPILALNCSALLAVFAGNLAMLRLGRELTGRTAVIAAVAGGVGLLAANMEAHFQLKGLALLVWALFFVVRFIRGSRAAAPCFIAVSAWLFLCSMYYAVMLVVVVATSLLLALAVGRGRFVRWSREAVRRVPVMAVTIVLIASLVPVGWVARHYLAAKDRFGGYGLEESVTYSARLGSLLDAPPTSLLYRTTYFDWGSHESRLFFGLLVWLGVAILAVGWRRWSMSQNDRIIVAFFALGALLATVLALGPFERHALSRGVHVPLPAYLYARFFPGFSALRALGRFGVIAAVFMAVLAEVGIRNLLDRLVLDSATTRLGYASMAALFVIDQATILKPQQIDLIPRRPIYGAIRALTPPEAVVLELPLTKVGHLENLSWWMDQMLGSTMHWRRIPTGYSGHESETLGHLAESYRAFERGQRAPAEFVADLRQIGITHIVIDLDLAPSELLANLRREFAARGFPEVPITPRASIFDCRPDTPPARTGPREVAQPLRARQMPY